MTAVAELSGVPRVQVSWEPPVAGAFTRTFRLGEWISEPVTPLFDTWLLTLMEERLHADLHAWVGQRAPRPLHVVVNGWYFYSLAWLSGPAVARNLPGLLAHLVREPRRVAGLIPPTVRHSVPLFEREWREDIQPRYRKAVERAEADVDSMPTAEIPTLVDELASLAGEYFASVAALGGAAYKTEMNLAGFCRRHLAATLGGGHLTLLSGLAPPEAPARHAVISLDWWHPSMASAREATRPPADHERLVATRRSAEEAATQALEGSARRLATFRRLLADAQHLVLVREEQARELTLAWPVLRRAVVRIGESLAAAGVIGEPDDVFFLTRDEVLTALGGGRRAAITDVASRRSTRDEQARLRPPMLIGRLNPVLRRMWEAWPRQLGASRSPEALVSGTPTSPGRASGDVRVVLGPPDFDSLRPGEVLVAPLTAPAWTPLFTRAAAVVTDVGSPASHASIIAREYGIPAVVGCADATARLATGMRVMVDGDTGNVTAADR